MKILSYGNYVGDGVKGLIKDGGSSRVAAVRKAIEAAGGTLECMYFSGFEYDYFNITNWPDSVSAAAVALTFRATGLVTVNAHVIMTAEEMDEAAKKSIAYRGPGQ